MATRRRQRDMNENTAALAIQSWANGNNARLDQEASRVNQYAGSGGSGAAAFRQNTTMRRRGTVRLNNFNPKAGVGAGAKTVFFAEDKFNASMKGIIDIQGRLTESFDLVIAMEKRNPSFDKDYTKYSSYLALHVTPTGAYFSIKRSGIQVNLTDMTDVVQGVPGTLGLEPDVITTYWLSYDRDNMTIKYGKGYAMVETTMLICDFSEGLKSAEEIARKRELWSIFFGIYDPTRKDATILLYRTKADIDGKKEKAVEKGQKAGFINVESLIEVRKEPLVVNPSPFVMAANKATMNLIDKNQYMFSSELPPACKVLYDTIVNSELDMEYEMGLMEYKLSDAIRYSMTTPGCLLYKTLQNKSYLRITIGPSAKESPGIPYVLEFWPPGSTSSVHNHGSVCAVIKCVFGTIQNGTYNKMPSKMYDEKMSKTIAPQELFRFDAYKGDVMWMSPEWFQTHQLRNVSNDYCATINCYRYDENDNIQWNLFDYVNDTNGQMGNFFPNTDFSYGEMRALVMDEYQNRSRRP